MSVIIWGIFLGILVANDENTDSHKYFVNIDENLYQILSKP